MQSATRCRPMKPSAIFLLMSAALVLLNGCATMTTADEWCLTNRPFRPTTASLAAMSDREIADALTHNEYGAKRCGWRP